MTNPSQDHPAAQPGQWTGGTVSERVHIVLCDNPSPMTLEGTNTYVLIEPGTDQAIVVDPGPLHEEHLQAIQAYLAQRGATAALTLLTHWHADHTESVPRWVELTGSPVRGAGHGADLADGEVIELSSGLRVEVIHTPGHTADSVSFLLPDEGTLITGDTILGRGTTMVAYPDGNLTAYLASLERLREVVEQGRAGLIGPAHGPSLTRPAEVIEEYLRHRHARLEEVRQAVSRVRQEHGQVGVIVGDADDFADRAEEDADLADLIVRTVYADVPRAVWPAARKSVLAQLDYLGEI